LLEQDESNCPVVHGHAPGEFPAVPLDGLTVQGPPNNLSPHAQSHKMFYVQKRPRPRPSPPHSSNVISAYAGPGLNNQSLHPPCYFHLEKPPTRTHCGFHPAHLLISQNSNFHLTTSTEQHDHHPTIFIPRKCYSAGIMAIHPLTGPSSSSKLTNPSRKSTLATRRASRMR
jgi:hypothetical protein